MIVFVVFSFSFSKEKEVFGVRESLESDECQWRELLTIKGDKS